MQSNKWWILASLGIGTFMSALDGSIVNAILPVIQLDLHCDMDTIQWVVTIYLLLVSGLLLTFGRVGDLRGHRSVCLLGFVLFVFGSALCGFASHIGTLITARGFQAFGAAMIFASSPAILTATFPAEQLGQALGLQATMTYLGLAFGPSLGGWLTDAFGWESVFFVNVPVGAAALVACRKFIPIAKSCSRNESFDRLGAIVFLAGLSLLLLTLNQAHAWGWTSEKTISLGAVSLLLLALFVRLQRQVRFPMLDLRLFRSPLFSSAVVSAVLNYMATAMVTFLIPFYLIKQLEWSPSKAGLLLTIQPLLMAITAPVSGWISDWLGSRESKGTVPFSLTRKLGQSLGGSRLPATLGMAILTVGLGWLACLSSDSTWHHTAVGLAVVGLGTGMFISPNNSALMGSAPANRRGIAAGVMATARNGGMMFGVAMAGAIVTTMAMIQRPLLDAISASFCIAAVGAAIGALFTTIREKK